MSNPTHPPEGDTRPVYFTHLEGNLTQRRTEALNNRLLDCQDEIRRIRDVLAVLEDAFCSDLHGDKAHLCQYGALSRHLEESLQCLTAELEDLITLGR